MLFNSYEFILLFLPLTFVGFFALGHGGQKRAATLGLVLASFFFYGYWDVRYVPLLFASISFNYLAGRQLERCNGNRVWLTFWYCCECPIVRVFQVYRFFPRYGECFGGGRYV